MTSNIDPTKPTEGNATTQSVRDNFAAAKQEIEALQAGQTLGQWTAPTFTNGWVNYGGTTQEVQYRKNPDGSVEIRGCMKNGAVGQVAFTLPIGSRPQSMNAFAQLTGEGVNQVAIYNSGAVLPSIAGQTYVWLSGIKFQAE